jgi:hypothetical protein
VNPNDAQHRSFLQRIARRVMIERGFFLIFRPRSLLNSTGFMGLQGKPIPLHETSGTFSGAPLTMMRRETWIS